MKPPNTERSITDMVPKVVATTKSLKTAAIARNIDIHERCRAKKIKNWRMNLNKKGNKKKKKTHFLNLVFLFTIYH